MNQIELQQVTTLSTHPYENRYVHCNGQRIIDAQYLASLKFVEVQVNRATLQSFEFAGCQLFQ